MEEKDLVQIIRDNPGCVATVDNDCWWLCRVDPNGPDAPKADDLSPEAYDAWEKENELACDSDIAALGDGGYGSGNSYGGDILQALAIIVGVKIQSV